MANSVDRESYLSSYRQAKYEGESVRFFHSVSLRVKAESSRLASLNPELVSIIGDLHHHQECTNILVDRGESVVYCPYWILVPYLIPTLLVDIPF